MSKYSDSYAQELKNLIDAKAKGKTYAKSVPVEKESPKDLVAICGLFVLYHITNCSIELKCSIFDWNVS